MAVKFKIEGQILYFVRAIKQKMIVNICIFRVCMFINIITKYITRFDKPNYCKFDDSFDFSISVCFENPLLPSVGSFS